MLFEWTHGACHMLNDSRQRVAGLREATAIEHLWKSRYISTISYSRSVSMQLTGTLNFDYEITPALRLPA